MSNETQPGPTAELAIALHGAAIAQIEKHWQEDVDHSIRLEDEADRRIREPGTLRELCEVLNAYGEITDAVNCDARDKQDVFEVWRDDFPTFGGREPASTDEVYSWDETDLLVNTGGGWQITEREAA